MSYSCTLTKINYFLLYASNLLKPECIVAVGDALSKLNLATQHQLADKNLGLGDATWMYLSGMEEELDPKPFYKTLRSFYLASLQKMLKIFHLEILFSRIWESLTRIKFVVMISPQ